MVLTSTVTSLKTGAVPHQKLEAVRIPVLVSSCRQGPSLRAEKISSKRVHFPPKSDIIMLMTVKALPCHEGAGGSLLRGAMAWVL